MAALISIVIRILHVIGMALLLGGAAASWFLVREDIADPIGVAVRFEWLFWATLGVMVVTGIGNLGAVGAPGPTSEWGQTFLLKLLLVLTFVVGSILRTLAVVRVDAAGEHGVHVRDWIRRIYASTAGILLFIVVLGEVLAHG